MLALFWKLLAWRFTRPVGLEGQLYSSQMSPVIFQFSSLKERDRGEERMREKEEERDFICWFTLQRPAVLPIWGRRQGTQARSRM